MFHLFSAGDESFTVAKMVAQLLGQTCTSAGVTSLGEKLAQGKKLKNYRFMLAVISQCRYCAAVVQESGYLLCLLDLNKKCNLKMSHLTFGCYTAT